MFVSLARACVVYVVKEVASFRGAQARSINSGTTVYMARALHCWYIHYVAVATNKVLLFHLLDRVLCTKLHEIESKL